MTIQPIRPDVVPTFDAAREMVQFVAEKMAQYEKDYGEAPFSIAFVLVGSDRSESITDAWSWTPVDDERSRLSCCAVASAVLLKRALGV